MRLHFTRNRLAIAACAALAWWVLAAPAAQALALLVPTDQRYQPLELRSQIMDVRIDNQAARTHIQQVFHNRYGRQIEATYLMPIPKGAHVTDFVMMMNGKKVRGEVLEKEKARQIYTNIVRRMRDPGLIEYVDQELFRARIFPIPPNGDQQVEITVTHLLPLDNGVVEYAWPFEAPEAVKRRGRAESPDEFDVKLDVRSKTPIKSVYSPTHKVTVDRKNEKRAVVRLDDIGSGEPLFRCYYTLSDKAVGLHALTYRVDEDRDGTFLLMISPSKFYDEKNLPPVDFTFVIDTSGSMNDDNKIGQAKKALHHCLGALRAKDAFTIIRFSTEAEVFEEKFLAANEKNLEAAKKFIEELRARGGTNIDEAMQEALGVEPREGRLRTILFITDGLPTVGVTNVEQILKNVEKHNKEGLRVFACGVGYDVNTKLLDRLADQTRALAQYIRPKEDLEVAIGQLFDKISHPVMTDLKIDWGELKVRDVYPKDLPDLFAGTQLIVFGRYRNGGSKAVTLHGTVGDEKKKFVYEAGFPTDAHEKNKFVDTLWATRRVGYLLAQIRQNGESKELRDEVVELAKKHGIVTPYTSYLVQEDQRQVASAIRRGGLPQMRTPVVRGRSEALDSEFHEEILGIRPGGPFGQPGAAAVEGTRPPRTDNSLVELYVSDGTEAEGQPVRIPSGDEAQTAPVDRMVQRQSGAAPGSGFGDYFYGMGGRGPSPSVRGAGQDWPRSASTGKEAVELSQRLGEMKDANAVTGPAGSKAAGIMVLEGRTFRLYNGAWVELSDKKPAEKPETEKPKVLKIKYLSDAYFDLVKLRPDLKKVLALGERVQFELNRYRIVIGPEGVEKLTQEQRDALAKKKN